MVFGLFKKKPSAGTQEKVEGEVAGTVTHYFPHVKACVIKLERPLKAGDQVRIKGHTTDFKEKVTSLQIMGKPVESGAKGQEVGLQVKKRVRAHDTVYKI